MSFLMSNYNCYRVWCLEGEFKDSLNATKEIYLHLITEGREIKEARPGKIGTSEDGRALTRNLDLETFVPTRVYHYHGASVSHGRGSIRGVRVCPCMEFVGDEGLSKVVDGFIASIVEKGFERKRFLKRKVS